MGDWWVQWPEVISRVLQNVRWSTKTKSKQRTENGGHFISRGQELFPRTKFRLLHRKTFLSLLLLKRILASYSEPFRSLARIEISTLNMPHLVDGAWHFECVQYLALSFLILPSQVPSPQNGAWMIWNRVKGKMNAYFRVSAVDRDLASRCSNAGKASLVNRFLAFCSRSENLHTNTSIWLSVERRRVQVRELSESKTRMRSPLSRKKWIPSLLGWNFSS